MKKIFYYLTLCLCTSFAFSSCSDDDDDEDVALTTEQLLMGGKKWQVTAATVTAFGFPSNVYETLEDCEKDNLLEFRSNQVLIVDEGATKCDSDDPQQISGTWTLNGDIIKVNSSALGLGDEDMDLMIEDITSTTMELSFTNIGGLPASGKVSLKVK